MNKIITFLTRDLWQIPLQSVSKFKAFWIRFLRVLVLTKQVIVTNQLQQGASSLTYYTLLGFVPMLVILIGVTRGFMQESLIIRFLISRFSNQKEIIEQLISFADNALVVLKSGLVAITGILILLWAAVKILLQLEITLNGLWNVKKGRPLIRKFSDYLAMILFSPLIFLIANGLIFYLSAKLSDWEKEAGVFKAIDPFLFFLYNILPYFLTLFLFTFIYIFMPNTKVRFKPALYGGLIAAALYQVIQLLYLLFQIGVTRYNAIYGTFAAIPLFLIWVHLSWVILLLGGKMAYAFQNVDAYEFMTENFTLSHRFKILLALRICHLVIRRYLDEQPPPSAVEISQTLSIPLALTTSILSHMVGVQLLAEVKKGEEESGYVPAHPVDTLTIKKVVDKIEEQGGTIPLPSSPEIEKMIKKLEELKSLIEKSDSNLLIRDI